MCDWSGSCCTMAKQLKGGYLLRHRKKIFGIGKAWREEWVILYDNSSLVWYKDRERASPEGGLLLKESPELLAVGLWTLRIPARPDLPDGCHTRQLMAFGTPGKEKVHWFLCKSEEEVNEWMTAISNTLPPPPKRYDDVISTPSRFKKTEILSHIAHHRSADMLSANCLVDYQLPKASSLGNGLMNAHQVCKSKSTAATPTSYPQRPLGSSKTTNGHQQHQPQYHHHNQGRNGLTNGHYHHGSSGALAAMDKIGRDDHDLASTLTMSTALGHFGWGWGWGPGWGWSGWSNPIGGADYSGFRGHLDHLSYGGGASGSGLEASSAYSHMDNGLSSFSGGEFAENIDIGIGASGLDDSLLDGASSAFDAFGGDFGF